LIDDPETSNQADIGDMVAALAAVCAPGRTAADAGPHQNQRLRVLLVEDDFVSRRFMELCDAYLLKPIDLGRLLSHMQAYRLVP